MSDNPDRRTVLMGGLLAPLLLPGAAAAREMFAWQRGIDYSGALVPLRPTPVGGGLFLGYVGIGSPGEFADWDRGRRLPTWSPVMVVFSRSADDYNDRTRRVQALDYGLSRHSLTFHGRSRLGPVSLRLAFTPAAHAILSRHENTGSVVARGLVSVGGRRIADVPFSYTVGE
jgi:hypothetical protein